MFAYCGNNPVNYLDSSGSEYVPVGGGVQFEITEGDAVIGIEIVIYWDVDECTNGAPVVAVYLYDGISMEVNDPLIGSVIATITDNSDILAGGRENISLIVAAMMKTINHNFSVSASGFLIFGNEMFTSTHSYEQSFTSLGFNAGKGKAGVAYSDSCFTIAAGYSIIGNTPIPNWSSAKTWYEQILVIHFDSKSNSNCFSRNRRSEYICDV